jgi:hypothetical protein
MKRRWKIADMLRVANRKRSVRGQALVEFALVMPLFLTLLFGLVEVSLIYASGALYDTAAHQAARIAALAAARASGGDGQAVVAIKKLVPSIFVAPLAQVVIYRSDASGAEPNASAENVFDANGNPIAPQTWPVASRISTAAAPVYLGVRITYHYTWLTSFVGAMGVPLTLQATAVVPIEPVGG